MRLLHRARGRWHIASRRRNTCPCDCRCRCPRRPARWQRAAWQTAAAKSGSEAGAVAGAQGQPGRMRRSSQVPPLRPTHARLRARRADAQRRRARRAHHPCASATARRRGLGRHRQQRVLGQEVLRQLGQLLGGAGRVEQGREAGARKQACTRAGRSKCWRRHGVHVGPMCARACACACAYA